MNNYRMVAAAACAGAGAGLLPRKRTHAKEMNVKPAPIKCRDGSMVIPYLPPSREQQLKRLKEQTFDVLVIGGGCVGSGVALDAAKRGMRTAMIEADDFGAGTSGRSTKLIHGGIRYLETAFKKLDIESYHLVSEALAERAYMLQAAPYMNHPLPIMIPIYKWWEVPYMWAGTKVYDLIAGSQRVVPPSHYMSKDEAMYAFPMLKDEGLKGAIIYYDGQMNDTRMSLTVALTATQEGAVAVNRIKAKSLLKDDDGKIVGARVQDTLSGEEWEVQAKAVVNATGCFADSVRKMADPEAKDLIVPAAGVHVMLPDHFSPAKMGLIVPKTSDGRVLFFLPWEGATLAGTTDSESPLTMMPEPTAQEVNFIITESNRYLKSNVSHDDAIAAWSGLRPLVRDPKHSGEGTKALSRNHVVEALPSGLVTICGGKWTTFRRMAEDTVDKVLETIPAVTDGGRVNKKCTTASSSLLGADRAGVVCARKFDQINVTLRNDYLLPRDVSGHLVSNYGTRALQIAEIVRHRPGFSSKSGDPNRLIRKYAFLEAEVLFAVEQEYAVKVVDVLARRTRLAFIDSAAAKDAAPRVAEIMGERLGWSKQRRQEELQEVDKFLATMSTKFKVSKSSVKAQASADKGQSVVSHLEVGSPDDDDAAAKLVAKKDAAVNKQQ